MFLVISLAGSVSSQTECSKATSFFLLLLFAFLYVFFYYFTNNLPISQHNTFINPI